MTQEIYPTIMELVTSDQGYSVHRLRTVGGWLVFVTMTGIDNFTVTYQPDAHHTWQLETA